MVFEAVGYALSISPKLAAVPMVAKALAFAGAIMTEYSELLYAVFSVMVNMFVKDAYEVDPVVNVTMKDVSVPVTVEDVTSRPLAKEPTVGAVVLGMICPAVVNAMASLATETTSGLG
jgi:uncharacterized PurR-regulated membrane protein YhhQ (DUF165 family)